ncbi:uncharacterized protein I303_100228 [Kwoniella dejecticola CBS 10117]|uniref:Mitochondrial protein n=1 Tax=Kwoniella dejecticola CBS 10117 TaxID=1296121 RepID=A0A1A6AEG2_9TREE|nr:mitochondrial protein [Kwoniella dejecticola CBS 10117]OBR88413.1 mitochondrial protein [Kwoniella dejecticola CBS 10117]
MSSKSQSILKNIPSIAKLPQKQVLEITGPDSPKFLKGLSCKDVDTLKGGYSGFLNASGRVLNTTFIFPTLKSVKPGKVEQSYLISYDEPPSSSSSSFPSSSSSSSSSGKTELEEFLIPFKLRSKIRIKNVTDQYDSYSVYGTEDFFGNEDKDTQGKGKGKQPIRTWKFGSGGASESQWSWPNDDVRELQLKENEIGCWDLRAGFSVQGMGRQVLVPKGDKPSLSTSHDPVSIDEYHLRRLLLGIPEGPKEIIPGTALPLESCMDLHGGVDFRKGCYLGQELTVRTYHTGATRKRILPIRLLPLVGGGSSNGGSSSHKGPVAQDQDIPGNSTSSASASASASASSISDIPQITDQLEITYHPPSTAASKKPRSAGKILSLHPQFTSVGLGLVRLEFAEKACWSPDAISLSLSHLNSSSFSSSGSNQIQIQSEDQNAEIGRLTTQIGDRTYGVYVDKGEAYGAALQVLASDTQCHREA